MVMQISMMAFVPHSRSVWMVRMLHSVVVRINQSSNIRAGQVGLPCDDVTDSCGIYFSDVQYT